jgi:hypothetical protein
MRRGVSSEKLKRSQALAVEAVKAKSRRTVRGVTGTIEELIDHFALDISSCTVRRRMLSGMGLDDALFTPRNTKSNLGELLGKHTMSDEKWATRYGWCRRYA